MQTWACGGATLRWQDLYRPVAVAALGQEIG
jgi:hypothetical protein